MSGVLGWRGRAGDEAPGILDAMAARVTCNGSRERATLVEPHFAFSAVGPAGTVAAGRFAGVAIALQGHVRWRDAPPGSAPADVCRRLAEAYASRGADAFAALLGDFAVALHHDDQVVVAVDRMGIRNVVHRRDSGLDVFAPNLRALGAHPAVAQSVDPQAVYDYVYFHMVPGPRTIFAGSQRLLAGHFATLGGATIASRPYWTLRFDEPGRCDAELADEFRAALETAVRDAADGTTCGTFLSGGTDSSTVTGFLAKIRGGTVDSFSIGFDASGYDEMRYARVAASHFRTRHHEYYVTPDDVADAVPAIAAEYDQPFGNASAVPTYHCAKLARDTGVTRLLAGDGGDELFGGNARYARQQMLAQYERVPRALRGALLDPLADSDFAHRLPLVRKIASFVRQARAPMPARYESYNLLERLGAASVFDGAFLASVDVRAPLAALTAWWHQATASSLVNRMLALDHKFTLADNDLPKVTRMCALAGVDVAFPLLDERLVEVAAALAPQQKVRGLRLRPFFKDALRGFLPEEVIAKTKHGFGLPAGPWLVQHPRLRALARDALPGLVRRGIVERRFAEDLLDRRLREHPGYYGTMVWILMMLELWFVHHVDER